MPQGSDPISPFEIMGKMSKRQRSRSHPMNVPNHAPDPYASYKHTSVNKTSPDQADIQSAQPVPASEEGSPRPKAPDEANPIFESKLLNVWQAPVTLRLPRGMIVIGFFCVTALVILSYKAGEMASRRHWQAILKGDMNSGKPDLLTLNVSQKSSFKPLNEPQISQAPAFSPAMSTRPRLTDLEAEKSLKVIPEKQIGDFEWLEGRVDPRVKNQLYFVLIHAPKGVAEKVVQFLAQQGVESAAIKRDNDRSFKVVLLEGFSPVEEKSKTKYYMDFESRIKKLGRRWESEMGSRSWNDQFTLKFDGKKQATVILTRKIK